MAAALANLHLLEQAGLIKRTQAVVDPALVEPTVRSWLEIGPNGIGLDAAIALDLDRGNGLGIRRGCVNDHGHRAGNGRSDHDQGSKQAAPENSQSKSHALSALNHTQRRPAPRVPTESHSTSLVANFT